MDIGSTTLTAKVSRSVQRFSTCEKCRCQYTFGAEGSGTARVSQATVGGAKVPLPGLDLKQEAVDLATIAANA